MQTILGANGTMARELSRALAGHHGKIRQVSRHPQRVHPGDETFAADLREAKATDEAVAGSEVVYLVVGLPYQAKIWEEQWPRLMRNVIEACQRHTARLVFLDNVYAYGRVDGSMTEESPFNPISRKGEVRARIATMLLDEMRAGNVSALIARSADFYGPDAFQSLPHSTVFQRLRAGRKPLWIGNPEVIHTFTFTPDAGRALAHLGQTPEAFGQTWHLPTSREPLTGAGFVRLACTLANQPERWQTVAPWLRKLIGLFIPILRENEEMMYQFEADYRFSSEKIEAAYGLTPTPYREGIAQCLQAAT